MNTPLSSALAMADRDLRRAEKAEAERDEALAALRKFDELDDANTLRDEWRAGSGPGMGDYYQSDDLCAAVTAARDILAKHATGEPT